VRVCVRFSGNHDDMTQFVRRKRGRARVYNKRQVERARTREQDSERERVRDKERERMYETPAQTCYTHNK